jgi:hypothetical protein
MTNPSKRSKSRSRSRPKTKRSKSRSKSRSKTKLLKIVRSDKPDKKYAAYFSDGTVTHFGAKGYQNYGGVGKEKHLDEDRKKAYIKRHSATENWNDFKSPGALSRWVLWNKPSFRESIADYKKRFNL